MISNEEGYTVVEIMVAMMLFMLIITITGSVFVFSSRQMINWQQSVNSLNEIHISSEILFKDLLKASNIEYADSLLVIDTNSNQQLVYSDLRNYVKRNGIVIADKADSHYISGVVLTDTTSMINAIDIRNNQTKTIELFVANRRPTLWSKPE